MLPLHTTQKNVICFSLATIIFLSCKSTSENDLTVTIALQESIESSSQMLAESSKEITTAFEERLRDPASSERAKIWLPKIKKVQQLSSDGFNYVESIKKDMVSKSNFSSELFEELMKYKKNILQIDPKITQ